MYQVEEEIDSVFVKKVFKFLDDSICIEKIQSRSQISKFEEHVIELSEIKNEFERKNAFDELKAIQEGKKKLIIFFYNNLVDNKKRLLDQYLKTIKQQQITVEQLEKELRINEDRDRQREEELKAEKYRAQLLKNREWRGGSVEELSIASMIDGRIHIFKKLLASESEVVVAKRNLSGEIAGEELRFKMKIEDIMGIINTSSIEKNIKKFGINKHIDPYKIYEDDKKRKHNKRR